MANKVFYLKLCKSNKIVLVDEKWYNICKHHKWRLNHKGYPKSRDLGLLHRFICGLKKGDPRTVHHRDGLKLNALRSNLQVMTLEDHVEIHRKRVDKKEK